MRALLLAATTFALAGCGTAAQPDLGDHFPDDLPAGWTYAYGPDDVDPEDFEDGDFAEEAVAVRVAGLQGPGKDQAGSIVAIRFADAGRARSVADAIDCDGSDVRHALRNGATVILVGVDRAAPPSARAAMDSVTSGIEDRTGADRVC